MVIEDLIHPDDKAAIMRALLLRHRHVNDHSHGSFHFGAKGRKYSSYSSLQVRALKGRIYFSLRFEDFRGNGMSLRIVELFNLVGKDFEAVENFDRLNANKVYSLLNQINSI